jgi:hypothetical protein
MSKKNIILLAVSFLAVAAFYYYIYKDSFHKAHIQLSHTFRSSAWALAHRDPNASTDDPVKTVIFGMERDYQLTSVKIISVPELETNKYAHPIWELISDSNSVPTRAFTYGMRIRGMHPPVKGAQPAALDLNVPYRLFVEAGKMKGEHDFTITPENHVAQ